MLTLVAPGLYGFAAPAGANHLAAAFDLDWTLVRSVKSRFFKNEHDWAFLPQRLITLQKLQSEGYTLVIFTNQAYKGAKLTTALARVYHILEALAEHQIYPWLFAATDETYRKPKPTMWSIFQEYLPTVQAAGSFYVGDAAGRPTDFSDSDREFAKACGLTFYLPEEIFPGTQLEIPTNQTMMIFVGMPGSGKSEFYARHLAHKGWVQANQDTLKTAAKVQKTVKEALARGQSVAVDATHPTAEKRRLFIDLAQSYGVPVIIVYFVANGYERNKLRTKPVPDIAYNMYFSKLEEPSLERDGVPVTEIEWVADA